MFEIWRAKRFVKQRARLTPTPELLALERELHELSMTVAAVLKDYPVSPAAVAHVARMKVVEAQIDRLVWRG